MINGAHSILYSNNADADRDFLRDVIGLPNVDVGGGWLIFGLPPAEVAVHPTHGNNQNEFYLMCDDITEFCAAMAQHSVACSEIQDEPWGRLVQITLPSGLALGVYEPKHARPDPA